MKVGRVEGELFLYPHHLKGLGGGAVRGRVPLVRPIGGQRGRERFVVLGNDIRLRVPSFGVYLTTHLHDNLWCFCAFNTDSTKNPTGFERQGYCTNRKTAAKRVPCSHFISYTVALPVCCEENMEIGAVCSVRAGYCGLGQNAPRFLRNRISKSK
ncbi:hypothetical protein BaRGS_00002017 [Batillaria attramentaria]|uniref:Uncharacterized protein n=1 Tax=Batillaria attramentaria TaxID=370345 RepID=A0ABD0M4T9_9CAEN